jgi:hypothetical protein
VFHSKLSRARLHSSFVQASCEMSCHIHHGGGPRIEGSRDRPYPGPWELDQGNDIPHSCQNIPSDVCVIMIDTAGLVRNIFLVCPPEMGHFLLSNPA